MRYPELERRERFNGLLSVVRDLAVLGKLCLGIGLFWLSMTWIGEVMGGSTAALFFHGVLTDFIHTVLHVFDAGKP